MKYLSSLRSGVSGRALQHEDHVKTSSSQIPAIFYILKS